jgi:hypothetical protein
MADVGLSSHASPEMRLLQNLRIIRTEQIKVLWRFINVHLLYSAVNVNSLLKCTQIVINAKNSIISFSAYFIHLTVSTLNKI